MQLKVNVNRLNVRKDIPKKLPEPGGIVGQVVRGYTFEGFEAPSIEIKNPALGTWYMDRDGYYYWGGGLTGAEEGIVAESLKDASSLKAVPKGVGLKEAIQFDPNKMSWGHDDKANGGLDIVKLWDEMGVRGEGVKIAILDSGITPGHIDLNPTLSKSFLSDQSIDDKEGHGTNMAGIIGAKGNLATGIAPESELYIAKTSPNDSASIIKALQWAIINNVDVVSLSFNCDMDSGIETELRNCFNKNIVLIAAAGNAGELDIIIDEYPASSRYCYCIGCFGVNHKRMAISNISTHLKVLAPGQNILTTSIGNKAEIVNGDTSIATALTSGVVALLLSFTRKINKINSGKEIMEAICQSADNSNNEGGTYNNKYGFGLIDPYKTYSLIK